MGEYIGSNVKLLRKEARLTESELAEKTGLTIERIKEIEEGNSKVYLKELEVLCPVLHISEEDIEERDLVSERSQAESKLKTSNVRKDYNWYYGDKSRVKFYASYLIIAPIIFLFVFFTSKEVFNAIGVDWIYGDGELTEVELAKAIIISRLINAYTATSIFSLVFMLIELFKKVKIPFYFWYIFIAGLIISALLIAANILQIPFYVYCFYKGIIKKGKNR